MTSAPLDPLPETDEEAERLADLAEYEARQIECRRRQRAVDQAEASGRLCPYGAEYVAGEWPFDPF